MVLFTLLVLPLACETSDAATTTQINTISQSNQTTTTSNVKATVQPKSTVKKVSASNVKITQSQIATTARYVKNYVATNHKLPNYIVLSSTKVTMPQYLELLTTSVIKINNKDTTPLYLKTVAYPSSNKETITSTSITKSYYLQTAKFLKLYMDKYHKVPSSFKTSSGWIQYSSLVFTYSKIIDFNKIEKRLPNSVTMTSWLKIIGQRPIYITSDYINNKVEDNARINSIVSALTAMGLYAKNWGLGPNTHADIIKPSSGLPKNALIVNIYGGACAGTILEMGTRWYMSYKGDRKVFSVFWPPSTDITGLAFLRRAHDDNFTPKYGESGGFPDVYDVDGNGKYETGLPGREDGLARPDLYLKKYGYKYLHSNDIAAIAKSIYNLAFS
jgi:hypothetical protein